MKVLYETYSPAPYRVSLLDEMGMQCELDAVFEKSREEVRNRDRRWFTGEGENYRPVYLKDCGLSGLLRLLRREPYDAAVVCGYSSLPAAASLFILSLRRIPVLLCADGMLRKKETVLRRKLKRFLTGLADGYLVSGRYTAGCLEEIGTGGKPVFLFPLTAVREKDLSVCHEDRAKLREKHGIRERTMILAAGQFIERKGYDLLMECVPFLDQDTGVYVCGGRPPGAWEDLAERYPNLHFPGFYEHEELLEMMRCCDIFVHPARYEIWGLAVSEAMMAGACVVTGDRCGAGLELVRSGENGMTVKTGDKDRLLQVLKQLAEDVPLREKLGRQAQADTCGRTVEKAAEDHLSALREICGK